MTAPTDSLQQMVGRIDDHEAAHDELQAAGFATCSAGPIRWRCHVERGAWKSVEHEGNPLRWDLCLADAKRAFPERFSPNRAGSQNEKADRCGGQ